MMNNIFHQIVRYDYAQKVVNTMRSASKHTILEVGAGAHGNLAKYLPEDDIVFLDVTLPDDVLEDKRFVVGDATDLEYAEDSFDFVIALDVIEHIPVDKRSAFVENINRVAKKGVILSAPFASENDSNVDELMKSFYRLNGIEPPVWVDEHIDCTLPTEESICELVYSQGVDKSNLLTFYGTKKSLMTKMLIMEAITSADSQYGAFFNVVNEEYIKRLLAQDIFLAEQDAIKLYAIWSKEMLATDLRIGLSAQYKSNHEIVAQFEMQYTDLMQIALQLLNQLQYTQKIDAFKNRLEGVLAEKESTLLEQINTRHNALDTQVAMLASSHGEMKNSTCSTLENIVQQQKQLYDFIQERVAEEDEIKLNVILITYNHSKFIKETLETILSQRTSFKFNIVVADDCSTDNTVELIKELEQTTSIPFVYLPNKTNLGIMQNYKRAFEFCNADYIAIMEGDDLWTDNLRLQKHVDFLENHSECAMTFNRFIVKNFEEGTAQLQPIFSPQEEQQHFRYVNGHDLAFSNLIGNFSTCVYRSSAIKAIPEQMYSIKCYDWLTNIMISRMGFIGCLIQPMSIYRIHSKGVWSSQSQKEQIKSMIEAIDTYDEYTNYEFTGGFTAHKNRLQATLAIEEMPINVGDSQKAYIKKVLKKMYRIHNYIPPIFVYVIKLLIPNVICEKIKSRLSGE